MVDRISHQVHQRLAHQIQMALVEANILPAGIQGGLFS